MKKRLGLLVVATCALISLALGTQIAGAWWNETGPNHKQLADGTVLPDWWNEPGPNH
ncbi:hypothetical protein JJB07_01990 [Tumebacillus sp. ITR2]|uniref:Uncharacterized protein n=1 Tax=Tumebacillus amylolyticus TaxID=2801339 RepID=A0ABS1J578_9BACL|nr:hypothetical protein [Tumebacillus amylolyticus]MBL0385406.1 hypothetical protein [Tumebacillus amylolyticus]